MMIEKGILEKLENIMCAFDITLKLNNLVTEEFQLSDPPAAEAKDVYKRAAVLAVAVQDRMENISAALGRLIDETYKSMRSEQADGAQDN